MLSPLQRVVFECECKQDLRHYYFLEEYDSKTFARNSQQQYPGCQSLKKGGRRGEGKREEEERLWIHQSRVQQRQQQN